MKNPRSSKQTKKNAASALLCLITTTLQCLPASAMAATEENVPRGSISVPEYALSGSFTRREALLWKNLEKKGMTRLHGRATDEINRMMDWADQALKPLHPDLDKSAPCNIDSETQRIHKATLYAADAAYDAIEGNQLAYPPPVGYHVIKTYLDWTGFKGAAFEADDGSGRKIFAIAGSEVFGTQDVRDWASGLGMGQVQASGPSAQEMVRDAFIHARHHGDSIITGQSQGGILAQGVAYFTQRNLDRAAQATGAAPKGKASLVTWGVTGGKEVIERILKEYRLGESYDQATSDRLNPQGYFFEWDRFARVGTYIGKTLAFPPEYAFTQEESVYFPIESDFGKTLEGHFLAGYRRASRKGGFCVAVRKERPEFWSELTADTEGLKKIGDLWFSEAGKVDQEKQENALQERIKKRVAEECGGYILFRQGCESAVAERVRSENPKNDYDLIIKRHDFKPYVDPKEY